MEAWLKEPNRFEARISKLETNHKHEITNPEWGTDPSPACGGSQDDNGGARPSRIATEPPMPEAPEAPRKDAGGSAGTLFIFRTV